MTDININQFSELLNDKADRDLGNLASPGGENHFINPALTNSPYTTNRILEIPQDIKVQLTNGNLVLKSGSKVYFPNGFEADGTTPHFDVIITTQEFSAVGAAVNMTDVIWLVKVDRSTLTATGLVAAQASLSISGPSGTTPPTGGDFYNTTDNTLKHYTSGSFNSDTSFPFCFGSYSNTSQGSGYVKSIDQIFNGFGYIGKTLFVLPGVKASLCNGLNDEGTYKHVELTTTTVLTTNNNSLGHNSQILLFNSSGTTLGITNAEYKYDAAINRTYRVLGHLVIGSPTVIVANFDYDSTGNISSLQPYSVDSVANSNMSNISSAGRSYLSSLGMPSDTGYLVSNSFATSTNFTAPSNGYFRFRAAPTTANTTFMVFLGNIGNKLYSGGFYNGLNTGQAVNCFLPVKQGQSVSVQHSNANLTFDAGSGLWFIPAEGEN